MRTLIVLIAVVVSVGAGAFALIGGALAPALLARVSPAPRGEVEHRTQSAGGQPPVRTRLSTETYAVSGESEEELLRSLLSGGPKTEDGAYFGLTTAETDVRYQTVRIGDRCAITGVEVDLRVLITLPEWAPPPGTSVELQHDWARFLHALRQHESEHGTIAERSANALYRSVSEIRRPTCAAAVAAGRQLVDRLQIEAEAAHRRFDEATGHGRTQGAAWPLS